MDDEESSARSTTAAGQRRSRDARFADQVRRGDPDACHHFFRESYPDIYRYLLWLAERPEVAEDLTQETLVRAWRHLDRFDDRASLRTWLHTIAHREFLRFLRGQREQAPLDEAAGSSGSGAAEWTESVLLREVIRRLSAEEAEIVVLHYLQGYDCREIAQIVGAPVSTVKYRLLEARRHLQRELGEGDLGYLNEPANPMQQWAWLPLDQMVALEARLTRPVAGRREETEVERREFLRQAAAGAAMLMEADKEVVDARLAKKVTLAVKGTALSDLCEHLRAETGVHLAAGASVADEKVTLFCQKLPLREVMRQLSRPFGYAWLRTRLPAPSSRLQAPNLEPGAGSRERGAAAFRYELVQDLRSQLLEEEMRHRNRNEALLALDREIERYRPYLDLSPDEALARSRTAPPTERELLANLAGPIWGVLQVYSRLSAEEQASLRAGQELRLAEPLRPGEQPRSPWFGSPTLPPDLSRQVLQSLRDERFVEREGRWEPVPDPTHPEGLPPAAIPAARGMVRLEIWQTEPGRFALHGWSHAFIVKREGKTGWVCGNACDVAAGASSSHARSAGAAAKSRLAKGPALRRPVSLRPTPMALLSTPGKQEPHAPEGDAGSGEPTPEPKVTTADVLEAVHRATSLPIVADYYTRLYSPHAVSSGEGPLFDILDRVTESMRLRWDRDGSWLQFRSTDWYEARLKEVPNRLLTRWAGSRRKHGALTLEDLTEIAHLPPAQLDGKEMAEGARLCWGLAEWDLARLWTRGHLRFLAEFTAEQRREALSPAGLPFTKMPLTQQQRFIAFALHGEPLRSLEELEGAVLRVEYTQPGAYQWGEPGWCAYYTRWVIPLGPHSEDRRVPRPSIQAPTREAALAAVRRVDRPLREALHAAVRRADPRIADDLDTFEQSQIFPTQRSLMFVYMPGTRNARSIYVYAPYSADTHAELPYRQR